MKVALDAENLRSSMRLWRDSVDIRIPMKDEFKLHFMERRREILGNFDRTADSWLGAFRGAVPEEADRADFEAFLREIADFRDWARAEIANIDALRGEG